MHHRIIDMGQVPGLTGVHILILNTVNVLFNGYTSPSSAL